MFSDFNILEQLSDITGLNQNELYQVIIGPFIFFMAGLFTNLVSVKLNQISKRRFLRLSIKAWLFNYKDKLEKQIEVMEQITLMLEGIDTIGEKYIPRIQTNVIENYSDDELRRVFGVTTFFGLVIHKKNMRSYMTIKQGLNDIIHINNDVTDVIKNYNRTTNQNLDKKNDLYGRTLNSLVNLRGITPIGFWDEFNQYRIEHFNNVILNKTHELSEMGAKEFFEKVVEPVRNELRIKTSELHPDVLIRNIDITVFNKICNDYIKLIEAISDVNNELKVYLKEQIKYIKQVNLSISDYLNEPDVITDIQPDYHYKVPFTNYKILGKKVAIAKVGKSKLKRVSFKVLGNKYIFVFTQAKPEKVEG